MAIPKRIIDLTTLALQDRVMTFKERETIIEEAVKMGVSKQEIEYYLTNAVNERLKSYSKEELTNCPSCGALVPLIDSQCLSCGKLLYRGGARRVVPVNVSGEAAQIIRSENEQTAAQRHERCQCGAPLPLVSNICEYCKAVLHEQADSDFNIHTLMYNIQASIDTMKQTLRPSFWRVLKSQAAVLCLFFAAAFFILGELLDNADMLMGGCCALPLAIILLSALNRGDDYAGGGGDGLIGWIVQFLFGVKAQKTPIDEADEQYYKALYSFEQYQRQIDTIYGKDAGAKRLLDDYAVEIDGYKKMRNRSRNMIAVLFVVVMAIPFVALKFVHLETVAEKYAANPSQYPDVYQALDFSKEIPCKFYKDSDIRLSQYFHVDGNADISLGVLHDNYIIAPENIAVKYQLRVSGVHLRSTGKVLETPDSCIMQGAFFSEDGHIVGNEFFPFKTFTYTGNYNYRTVIGRGKGDVYVDFFAKKGSPSVKRLKEVADSASYFVIF